MSGYEGKSKVNKVKIQVYIMYFKSLKMNKDEDTTKFLFWMD